MPMSESLQPCTLERPDQHYAVGISKIFVRLAAKPMSPSNFTFPVMNIIVGELFPETSARNWSAAIVSVTRGSWDGSLLVEHCGAEGPRAPVIQVSYTSSPFGPPVIRQWIAESRPGAFSGRN